MRDIHAFRKNAAGILGLFMLFVFLFSWGYIAAEAEHDCSGEECEICLCIEQCLTVLNRIGEGTAFFSVSPSVAALLLILVIFITHPEILRFTPVSNKVRLNN